MAKVECTICKEITAFIRITGMDCYVCISCLQDKKSEIQNLRFIKEIDTTRSSIDDMLPTIEDSEIILGWETDDSNRTVWRNS